MTTELHEKIGRQRAALEVALEGINALEKRHTDEPTLADIKTMRSCIEKGLEVANDFDPFAYHVRGLLNVFMRQGRDAETLIRQLEEVFFECKQWGLVSAIEERACHRLGRYPVDGNYLIEMRDNVREIVQFLPTLEGDGETDRWVQDAAVQLFAVVHHALPTDLKHITLKEWVERNEAAQKEQARPSGGIS